jgi:caffeoyl-CoA O-methyltransferase
VQLVDEVVERYAEAHSTPATDALAALAAEARATLPLPQMLSGLAVGRLLETLVFAMRAQLVLEIGTYAGYSALAMAAGLGPGGRVITCELDDDHARFARRHIDASPYADRVELRIGPARDTIAALDGPFDFAFIDADKSGYPDYFEAVLPKLAPHGVIAIDNTLHGGQVLEDRDQQSESTRAIADLNERLAHDERVVSVLLTVRDGVTLVHRR